MIKPLPGYVLIEPIEDDGKTGEIYLPETSKDKPSKGKVIKISGIMFYTGEIMDMDGSSIADSYKGLNEGSIVVYKKWTNQEIEYEGKKYMFVAFSELLGVIE